MSDRTRWATPQTFVDALDREFGFDADVCAEEWSRKADHYFNKEADALSMDWGALNCWMNPPFDNLAAWMEKAWRESLKGATVVALIPAATDTNWFWDWVLGKAEIRFIKGRVQFEPPPGVKASSNPYPSLLAVYRPFGARI